MKVPKTVPKGQLALPFAEHSPTPLRIRHYRERAYGIVAGRTDMQCLPLTIQVLIDGYTWCEARGIPLPRYDSPS